MQKYEDAEEFDHARTARLGLFRLLFFGPAYSVWLKFLESQFGNMATAGRAGLAKKIALDQFLWAPPALGSFYVSMSLMEGNGMLAGLERCRTCLWKTLCYNWMLWIPMQCVTLSVVPITYRVAFVSVLMINTAPTLLSIPSTTPSPVTLILTSPPLLHNSEPNTWPAAMSHNRIPSFLSLCLTPPLKQTNAHRPFMELTPRSSTAHGIWCCLDSTNRHAWAPESRNPAMFVPMGIG